MKTDIYSFDLCHSILLRLRNVSDKICKVTTRIFHSVTFFDIVSFMR